MRVPMGTWLIAGSPLGAPYPCRCRERIGKECSAAWCPCAGRPAPWAPGCCGAWNGPAEHRAAMAEWRARKLEREAAERDGEDA